jgi:hypothetical protein
MEELGKLRLKEEIRRDLPGFSETMQESENMSY